MGCLKNRLFEQKLDNINNSLKKLMILLRLKINPLTNTKELITEDQNTLITIIMILCIQITRD